jgi:hypothetical protein
MSPDCEITIVSSPFGRSGGMPTGRSDATTVSAGRPASTPNVRAVTCEACSDVPLATKRSRDGRGR